MILKEGQLALRLLGGLGLTGPDGTAIDLPTRKSRLLLAYLAVPAGQSHAREKLAALFWGDTEEEQARASLRQALSALRKTLGPDALAAEPDRIALAAGVLRTDIDRLAEIAAGGPTVSGDEVGTLYLGDFLEGLAVPGEELDEWIVFERTRCRNLAHSAFEHCIDGLLERRPGEAITLAQRLVAIETPSQASAGTSPHHRRPLLRRARSRSWFCHSPASARPVMTNWSREGSPRTSLPSCRD